MAISLKSSGTWAAGNGSTPPTVALVGSPAAGDRSFLWAVWRDFSLTASVAGWTKIAEFADGTVTQGNGLGSTKIACWYRDWQSGDGSAVSSFGGASIAIYGVVMELWQKGAAETWSVPVFQTGDWPNQSTGSAQGDSAAIVVPSGSVVMAGMGIRDDSATFTRPTTGIALQSGAGSITWAGNYVESPATHLTTIAGSDIAADLGHRFVTSGTSTAVLNVSATLSAAETGSVLWVVQGVTGAPAPGSSDDSLLPFF